MSSILNAKTAVVVAPLALLFAAPPLQAQIRFLPFGASAPQAKTRAERDAECAAPGACRQVYAERRST